ncbi:MAG TPA: DUF1192 domain-containing protein [Enterovirga sp.]|jgi:uncharacterized small protein (DUF1192 family)|nr:DUF1192 domain-containing protein [Enterovirga sp.]
MIGDEAESRSRAPTRHEIGADLSAVSVDELQERIQLLAAEIERLHEEIRRKEASRNAAAAFFKT